MLQRSYSGQVCSIARALEVVGERWTLLILRDANLGLHRFEEFEQSLGIASNVLSTRLKRLCDEDVLERQPDPERPGRPEYVLTAKGQELGPALITLMKWGDRHYPAPGGVPRITLHVSCGGRHRGFGSPLRALRQACGPRRIRPTAGPRAHPLDGAQPLALLNLRALRVCREADARRLRSSRPLSSNHRRLQRIGNRY